MDNTSNNFPENELFGFFEDRFFKWKEDEISFLPFITVIGRVSESRLIDILKEFTEAGGRIFAVISAIRRLNLKIKWPSFKECIVIEDIAIDFYNKLVKIVPIDTNYLYNEIRVSKQAIEIYKKFSDEEKLKFELWNVDI